jgi:hypothetical protein
MEIYNGDCLDVNNLGVILITQIVEGFVFYFLCSVNHSNRTIVSISTELKKLKRIFFIPLKEGLFFKKKEKSLEIQFFILRISRIFF